MDTDAGPVQKRRRKPEKLIKTPDSKISATHVQECWNGCLNRNKRESHYYRAAVSVFTLLTVLFLSLFTRFYKLDQPPHVWLVFVFE